MNEIFFTADTHFFHKNILHLGKGRPFNTIEEMNEILIENWNKVVSKKDIIYHLGDFAFKSQIHEIEGILNRLNGNKILIKGNHDSRIICNSKKWSEVYDYKEIKIDKQKIVLFHYPLREWNGSWKGSFHLYGHCHNNLPDDPKLKSFDVGVDGHNFKPISFEEVKKIINMKR